MIDVTDNDSDATVGPSLGRREQILNRIKSRLAYVREKSHDADAQHGQSSETRTFAPDSDAYRQYVASVTVNYNEDTLSRFVAKSRNLGSSVELCENKKLVKQSINNFVAENALPLRFVMGTDKLLSSFGIAKLSGFKSRTGRALPDDRLAISAAVAAIAETGTLMVTSGKQNPVTLNYLPPYQIMLVSLKDICRDIETAYERCKVIRSATDEWIPRTVNFISGPSRSADIGQQLQIGAHGPIKLHIIIVR